MKSQNRMPYVSAVEKYVSEKRVPFPPDIPIIVPGERISHEIIDYVEFLRKNGTMIVGLKDTTLDTIEVIEK